MAQDTGLEIPSVGVWSLWENNLVSNDPSIRQKAEDIIKKQIECAALMGADTILVVPGYVGCDFASKPERIRYDVAYERCVKAFRSLAPLAERAGVSIGIENVWNRFLLSPLEMKRLVQDPGKPDQEDPFIRLPHRPGRPGSLYRPLCRGRGLCKGDRGSEGSGLQ